MRRSSCGMPERCYSLSDPHQRPPTPIRYPISDSFFGLPLSYIAVRLRSVRPTPSARTPHDHTSGLLYLLLSQAGGQAPPQPHGRGRARTPWSREAATVPERSEGTGAVASAEAPRTERSDVPT